jgi:hypothetical protein
VRVREPDTDSRVPASPVIGMSVAGSGLILLAGVLEFISIARTVTGSGMREAALGLAGLIILLAGFALLTTWIYALEPSRLLGVGFIVLGSVSLFVAALLSTIGIIDLLIFGALGFFLTAAFLVGGVLLTIAGGLANIAAWVEDLLRPHEAELD